jgi:transcriptional regulator with XRE-family HTH domain
MPAVHRDDVNDVQAGAVIKAIRIRRGWRQVDLADAAGVSQQEISIIELGRLDMVSVRSLRHVARALDVAVGSTSGGSGGFVDRLLDERHADLVGHGVTELSSFGWQPDVEVSYAHYAERGSIDILCSRADRRIVLVVEVKSRLVSVEAMMRKLDEKTRLASRIASERLGWRQASIARLLILPSTEAARSQVSRQRAVLGGAFPLRAAALRAWLANPSNEPARGVSGLLYVTPTKVAGGISSVTRVRRPRAG